MSTEIKENANVTNAELNELVSNEILSNAEKIKEHLTIDNDNGLITIDSKAFESTLPEGVTINEVQKCMNAIGDYTLAAQIVVSETGINMMKENKELSKVTSTVNLGSKVGNVAFLQTRHTSGPVPGKDGEKWEKSGSVSAVVDLKLVSTKRGASRKVRDYFCTLAEKELKND